MGMLDRQPILSSVVCKSSKAQIGDQAPQRLGNVDVECFAAADF